MTSSSSDTPALRICVSDFPSSENSPLVLPKGDADTPSTYGGSSVYSERSYNSERSFSSRLSRTLSEISLMIKHHTGTIGTLGSMSIAVNSLTGPAMLNIPATFQKSGIIPTTLCLIFVCALSSQCSLHMANTITKVPGNHKFQKEIEFSDVFQHFWGERWFAITQFAFFCCITVLNISSIVDNAQVIDTFLGHWIPGGSAALRLSSEDGASVVRWDFPSCFAETQEASACNPFEDQDGLYFTVGYFLTTVLFLPLGLMDLQENAQFQVLGFAILLLTSIQFAATFYSDGLSFDNVSMWGESWDTLFGVILFNFALVIAVPAWLYEKEPDVDVPTVINGSSILSTILYILVGVTGAMAVPNVSDNMLETMMSGEFGTMMQLGASIFAFFIVGLSIPLFGVLGRLNLTGSGLCSKPVGDLLAVYMPFAVSWLLYQGSSVTQLLSWGGIIFTSAVAFLLPLMLAYHVLDVTDEEGSIQVYGGYKLSYEAQKNALYVLLALTIMSVIAAVVGNLL